MLLLYEQNKKVVVRIMNLALMKFSLLPCGLKHILFFFTDDSPPLISILSILYCVVKIPHNLLYALFPKRWFSSCTSSCLQLPLVTYRVSVERP